jgi:hypothetical protein
VGRNGGGYRSDLGKERTGIFLREGLDRVRAEQARRANQRRAELAVSSYTPVSPVFCREEAGSLRAQMGCTTSFLMASVFRSRLKTFSLESEIYALFADMKHTLIDCPDVNCGPIALTTLHNGGDLEDKK